MHKFIPLFCGFFLCFCFHIDSIAQQKYSKFIPDSERFSAGLVFGYNNAQIDGDYQTGFDKIGITGGLRGIARFTPRLDLNIEMLYSKKGSKILSNEGLFQTNPKKNRIIDLTYIDAPIYFKWLLKNQASTWHVELGGIYSRLIKTEITEEIKNPESDFAYEKAAIDFKKDDLSILMGFGHTWQNGIALHLRYMFGVNKFYENADFEVANLGVNSTEVEFLRNYYYSLSISYTIFKRQLKKGRK